MGESARYDTEIVIQKLIDNPTSDRTGKPDLSDDDNWETFITRHGEYRAITGMERVYGGKTTTDVTHRITIRDDPESRTITGKNRLSIDGTIHGITSVVRTHQKTDHKKRIVEIMAMTQG